MMNDAIDTAKGNGNNASNGYNNYNNYSNGYSNGYRHNGNAPADKTTPDEAKRFAIRLLEASDVSGMQALYMDKSVYWQSLHLPDNSFSAWQQHLQHLHGVGYAPNGAPAGATTMAHSGAQGHVGHFQQSLYSYVALIGDEIVGNAYLQLDNNPRRRHVAHFGIAIKHAYQSKGIGDALVTFVFNLSDKWLNIHRIEATIFSDNEKGINFLTKHGFLIEGEAANFAFQNGRYVTAYYMARLAHKDAT